MKTNEKNQLEQWTNKKCSEVIFDSDKDNWSQNTSVLNERIIGKKLDPKYEGYIHAVGMVLLLGLMAGIALW